MSQTGSRLQRAREEEKKLRKLFQSSHGQHFVTTLFPELQDRVPEITVSRQLNLAQLRLTVFTLTLVVSCPKISDQDL